MIRISILRLKHFPRRGTEQHSVPTNDKNLNSEIETPTTTTPSGSKRNPTNDKNLNSEIETAELSEPTKAEVVPTNDKNLNSEIETWILPSVSSNFSMLPMIRISILRLKHLRVGLQIKNLGTTNDKNLNSEIETKLRAVLPSLRFLSTNDKNLNSEIETANRLPSEHITATVLPMIRISILRLKRRDGATPDDRHAYVYQ